MIKLSRPAKPAYLTAEKEAELVAIFKSDGSVVWKDIKITESLLEASHQKCAFCECRLQETDSYMEVEHFRHKSDYPDYVVNWENLLPSCKRCNTKKGTHDVVIDPIVNPFDVTPAEHLRLDMAYVRPKDAVGHATVEVLDLNSIDRLVLPRFRITTALEKNIDAMQTALGSYLDDRTVRRRNKLTGIIRNTLRECQVDTVFSATAATFLHRSDQYKDVCAKVRAEGLWDDDLERLHQSSEAIRLDR